MEYDASPLQGYLSSIYLSNIHFIYMYMYKIYMLQVKIISRNLSLILGKNL